MSDRTGHTGSSRRTARRPCPRRLQRRESDCHRRVLRTGRDERRSCPGVSRACGRSTRSARRRVREPPPRQQVEAVWHGPEPVVRRNVQGWPDALDGRICAVEVRGLQPLTPAERRRLIAASLPLGTRVHARGL